MAEVVKYVTPVFRASFPHVYEAQQFEGSGEPKFGVSAVFTPAKFTEAEKALWKKIGEALNAESNKAFKCDWKDLPANIKRGLRDGSERADMEGYGAGTKFANVTSKMRPGIVDKDGKTPIGPEHGNADLIYPGCYMRATVTVYSYNNKGKGVAIGLMNLQKVADGERLDSRTNAAEDFADMPMDSAYADKPEDPDFG